MALENAARGLVSVGGRQAPRLRPRRWHAVAGFYVTTECGRRQEGAKVYWGRRRRVGARPSTCRPRGAEWDFCAVGQRFQQILRDGALGIPLFKAA